MKRIMSLATALCLACCGFVSADEPAIVEGSTTAPIFRKLVEIDFEAKRITVEEIAYRPVFETREVTVMLDGVPRTVTETVVRQVPETRHQRTEFVALAVVHPSGKAVDKEKLADFAKTKPKCVISTDPSGNINQEFVKLLRDDAIILLMKPRPMPVILPPMPMP